VTATGKEKTISPFAFVLICGSPKSKATSLTEYTALMKKAIRNIQKNVVAIPNILIGTRMAAPFPDV
jgi:hypothetical protein